MSLSRVLEVLWQRKWPIIITTAVLSALAAIAALIVPETYRATILLSAVVNSGGGQLGALGSSGSELGGLASLAGIPIGENAKKAESVAVLQSEALTEKYIAQSNLLPILYKHKWDAARGSWKSDKPKDIPTLWKANEFFKKSVRIVTSDTKTGLVTLSITWADPRTAAKWANELVVLCNDYLRGKAIAESERSIAFLNEQAAKTNVVEARQAIFKSLEVEINKRVMAEGNTEYAFRVIDPAVAPEKPHSPQFLIWVASSGFFGLIVSAGLILTSSSSTKLAS